MKVTPFVGDALLLEADIYEDARGFFFESFNQRALDAAIGRRVTFVQDNHAGSRKNVLRGLHYQLVRPQAKVVRVLAGEVFDVAVDLRRGSPTFCRWNSTILSARSKRQLWLPAGFAHGYLVLSDHAEILVKVSDYWAPEHERCITWRDTTLAIPWPLRDEPVLSRKDREGVPLHSAQLYD